VIVDVGCCLCPGGSLRPNTRVAGSVFFESFMRNYDGSMNIDRFKSHRKDGWPLCPMCGDDELVSILVMIIGKAQKPPTMEDLLGNGFWCYACGWVDD